MSVMFEFLNTHRERMIDDIHEFVRRETPSSEKKALDEFADFLVEYGKSIPGCVTRIVKAEKSGNHVVLNFSGTVKQAPVLLVGHYDTVWPLGTLAKMPFEVDGDVARGPGIFDMKAGLVQAMWAIRALQATDTEYPPLIFVMNSDEEVGSPESRSLIAKYAREACAALVFEPSHHGAVKTQRKGVGRYIIDVQGRASHAGLAPEDGISAIDELARMILEIHGWTQSDLGTTVNVGVISGGSRYNVVAAEARADVDVRVASVADAERIDRKMRELRPRNSKATIRIKGEMLWPPMMRNSAIGALYERVRFLAREELGLDVGEAAVGGASDGCTCAAVGIPVIDGMGAVGDGAHAATEHIYISHLAERAALAAHVIHDLVV